MIGRTRICDLFGKSTKIPRYTSKRTGSIPTLEGNAHPSSSYADPQGPFCHRRVTEA